MSLGTDWAAGVKEEGRKEEVRILLGTSLRRTGRFGCVRKERLCLAAMSTEPPWACLPASHVSATLTSRGEVIRIDDPLKKFYRCGRQQEMVDIHVKCQTASRVHAILAHHKDGGLYIFDLQSANGTFIDGIRVPAKKETRLRPGSKLRFGEADSPEYLVQIEDKRVDAKQGMLASLGGYGDGEEEEEEFFVPVKKAKREEKDDSGRDRGRGDRERDRGGRDRDRDRSRSRDRSRDRSRSRSRGRERDGGRERRGDGGSNDKQGTERRAAAGIAGSFSGNPVGTGAASVAEKRKMLWGNKGPAAQTGTWEKLSTSLDAGAQSKFMQLMGGKKHGNEAHAGAENVEVEDYPKQNQMKLSTAQAWGPS